MTRFSGPILVVDDDAGFRSFAKDLLERAGYEILEAADGDEALRAVEAVTPASSSSTCSFRAQPDTSSVRSCASALATSFRSSSSQARGRRRSIAWAASSLVRTTTS